MLYNYGNPGNAAIKLSGVDAMVTKIEVTNSHVFWLDSDSSTPGLHYYSIINKQFVHAVDIPTYPASSDYGGAFLSAWTDKVVYTTPGATGMFLFNATTGTNTKLTDTFVNGLDYQDGLVVYTDTNINGGTVYKQVISTGIITTISTDNTKAASFSDNITMSNNRAVWQVGGTKPNMYFYNLETGAGKFITSSEKNRYNPRMGASLVVWSEADGGNSYLGIYNYNKDELTYYAPESGNINWPDATHTQVVFSSNRSGETNIYSIDSEVIVVPEPEPVVIIEQDPAPIPPDGVESGDLIKGSSAAVYYYGADGKRYVFPNSKCYFTWYDDFSTVKMVSDGELADVEIGGNVTYRPGVKMIKAASSNKVYAVAKNGVRRWIGTEVVAKALYGDSWNTQIQDVPDSFWVNYTAGDDVISADDYNPAVATAASSTINIDKSL